MEEEKKWMNEMLLNIEYFKRGKQLQEINTWNALMQ